MLAASLPVQSKTLAVPLAGSTQATPRGDGQKLSTQFPLMVTKRTPVDAFATCHSDGAKDPVWLAQPGIFASTRSPALVPTHRPQRRGVRCLWCGRRIDVGVVAAT